MGLSNIYLNEKFLHNPLKQNISGYKKYEVLFGKMYCCLTFLNFFDEHVKLLSTRIYAHVQSTVEYNELFSILMQGIKTKI